MTVWAVVIEWQHCASWDEGAAELYAVCATEARAEEQQQAAIDLYSAGEFNYTPYWNPKTQAEREDWDFDVTVRQAEVLP